MTARAEFYERIAGRHLKPLWEVLDNLVPEHPRSAAQPALWRYGEVRPFLLESGRLISAREAVRRVLILENPGLPGSSAVTRSLYAGLQLILPGEVAPSHRHTQSALRFVVEGRGAYTAVDGERVTMQPGDFIITPSWTWHDHGNPGDEPVVWLDGLDIPMVAFFDAGFAERHPEETQPVSRDEGVTLARYGENMAPPEAPLAARTSPIFSYSYGRSRAALARLHQAGEIHPARGVKLRYVNPLTGGYAMPTIASFLQLLPKGFSGRPQRSTDGTVYCVVEGEGVAEVGEARFHWGPHDVFVVPSWVPLRFEAAQESVLFSYSDRPVQEALGIYREEA
ncbi:MAG: gentisate 1,2-dioxygenase [Pseudomonadota bacterium]|jgi:gentisate 1,2-dioxygenase